MSFGETGVVASKICVKEIIEHNINVNNPKNFIPLFPAKEGLKFRQSTLINISSITSLMSTDSRSRFF